MTDSHLYFLFIILGLYLMAPLLRAYVAKASLHDTWMLASFFFLLAFANLLANNSALNAFTRFYPYLSYFLAGYLLRVYEPSKKVYLASGCAFFSMTAVIALGTEHLYRAGGKDNLELFFDHFFPAVILQSFSIFLLLRLSGSYKKKPPTWLQELGDSSFGIYLVHITVLDWLRQYTSPFYSAHVFETILAEVFLVALISTILVVILRRIPGVRLVFG